MATDLEKSVPSEEQSSNSSSSHVGEPADSATPELVLRDTVEPNHGTTGILEKVLSRTRSHSSYVDPGPPPDGGLGAWTQVLCGHLLVCNTWGYISSFGVFQTYYVGALGHPPSDISWVGSVQIFFLFFIGTFSGRATDYGLLRPTILLGSFLMIFGVFMTSMCTKYVSFLYLVYRIAVDRRRYWQLFLAQGICTGLGNGLLFCPALSVLSTYFSSKRSLAIGLAASGSATGGLIFPAIVQQLLPKIGFPWTVRVVGFVMLATQIVAVSFTKQRLPPRKSGPLVEWAAFKEPPYTLFSIGIIPVVAQNVITDDIRHVP